MTPEDEAIAAFAAAFDSMPADERVTAYLHTLVGLKAAAHSFEHGDVTIEQIDMDTAEDGHTLCATGHLSDGHAVVACIDPRE